MLQIFSASGNDLLTDLVIFFFFNSSNILNEASLSLLNIFRTFSDIAREFKVKSYV